MTASGRTGGSSSTSVAGGKPAAGRAAAVTAPQLWPTTWRSGRSEPGRPDEGGDVGGVVAEPDVARPVPGPAVPAWSTATTRRPVAASAGPTRHQTAADAVTPWMSSSGALAGSPQTSADHGIPATSTVVRSPGSRVGERGRDRRRERGRLIGLTLAGGSGAGAIAGRIAAPVAAGGPRMANQFVVQLKNEPGSMASSPRRSRPAASTCARSAAAASAIPAT